MTSRSNPDRQKKIDELKLLCMTLIDCLSSLEGEFSDEMVASFRAGINGGAERRSLAGLRMALSDLISMIHAVPARRRSGLDLLLRERTGLDLEQLLSKQTARVRRVMEAGKIRNETQYYLLREHLELVTGDPSRANELSDVQRLLHDFEERQVRRLRDK